MRRADPQAREITVDFVVHGEHGVAGPWASSAQPGHGAPDGAGRRYAPDPAADWHLFAADEAGLPAVSAALEALPPDAIGKVFIEIAGPEDEIALRAPESVAVNWVYRGGRADLVGEDRAGDNAPLIEAVTTAHWLPGQVQVFIHGEAQAVMHNLRPYIRQGTRRARAVGVDLRLLAPRPHRRDVPAVEAGTRGGRGRRGIAPPPSGSAAARPAVGVASRGDDGP